jgi:hypothetical protein
VRFYDGYKIHRLFVENVTDYFGKNRETWLRGSLKIVTILFLVVPHCDLHMTASGLELLKIHLNDRNFCIWAFIFRNKIFLCVVQVKKGKDVPVPGHGGP